MSVFLEGFHFPSRDGYLGGMWMKLMRTALLLNHWAVWRDWERTGAWTVQSGLTGSIGREWCHQHPIFLCLFIVSPLRSPRGVGTRLSCVDFSVCIWGAHRGPGCFYCPRGRRGWEEAGGWGWKGRFFHLTSEHWSPSRRRHQSGPLPWSPGFGLPSPVREMGWTVLGDISYC